MAEPALLDSSQMADFAANGFLMMDGVVPTDINQQFLADIGYVEDEAIDDMRAYYRKVMTDGNIPVIAPGTPLSTAYPKGCAVDRLLALPRVSGAIKSLVGSKPVFDHHFLHITFPKRFHKGEPASQHYHQDSTIDPRSAFDVQVMYFPHEVVAEMGGTRYLPGSHLRIVSTSAIGRYQNFLGQRHVVCPAGSLLFLHMGIWHGGGLNQSDRCRYMFKIRMCPSERQCRLWDDSDLGNDHFAQRPIFWTDPDQGDSDSIAATLMKPQPWFEQDTARLELMNRIRFWRYLIGAADFDADYWMTRIENEFLPEWLEGVSE